MENVLRFGRPGNFFSSQSQGEKKTMNFRACSVLLVVGRGSRGALKGVFFESTWPWWSFSEGVAIFLRKYGAVPERRLPLRDNTKNPSASPRAPSAWAG